MNSTTLQIRVNKKTKEKARRAFAHSGLDLSSGTKLFLTHVANTGAVPFEIFTADNLPEKTKRAIMREAKHALKHGKSYQTAEELHRDILGKK